MRRRAEQRGWTGARAKNRRAAKAALFCARDEGKPRVAQPLKHDKEKCEDRRAGEITTERMPANQEAAKRILFGGEVVGVIDPAARPIRSMTASAQISYPSLRLNRQSSLIPLRLLSKTDPLCWALFWDRLRAGFNEISLYPKRTSLPGFTLPYTKRCGTFCVFLSCLKEKHLDLTEAKRSFAESSFAYFSLEKSRGKGRIYEAYHCAKTKS